MMEAEITCRRIDDLLPWYINRSLTAREAEIVQSHLCTCDRCRDEAEWLAQLAGPLRDSSMKPASTAEAELPLAALRRRIANEHPAGHRPEWRSPVFALAAGMLLALAVTLGVVLAWQPFAPRYHTVTDPLPAATNRVMLELELAPDAPISSLYRILETYDGTVVDGPDAQGRVALEFRLAAGEDAGALVDSLREDEQVSRIRVQPSTPRVETR